MRSLIFLGPPQVLKLVQNPEPKVRTFLIVAHDGSCNVQLEVDEPWMSDKAIGDRLSGSEGLQLLISSAANHVLHGGQFERA